MPVNSNIYKVNWNRVVSWLIPSTLFQPKMFAFCKALVAPVSTLHNSFLAFRKQRLYDLTITPQVCYLQKLLNDKYDADLRRIFIGDGKRGDDVYVFQDAENEPLFVFQDAESNPVWIFNDGEVGNAPAHFIVNIPNDVVYDVFALRSLINIYKLPSRRYQIQTF